MITHFAIEIFIWVVSMMGCCGKLSAFVVYWCIQRNVNDLMFKPNFSCYYSRIQFCCSFCVPRLFILAFLLGLNKCFSVWTNACGHMLSITTLPFSSVKTCERSIGTVLSDFWSLHCRKQVGVMRASQLEDQGGWDAQLELTYRRVPYKGKNQRGRTNRNRETNQIIKRRLPL
jgi:hypothetical protein